MRAFIIFSLLVIGGLWSCGDGKTYVEIETEFDIMFGEGISQVGSILEMAAESGIIHKSGAWYSYNDERIGQGKENAKIFLKENPEICREIEIQVRTLNNLIPSESDENEESTDETL